MRTSVLREADLTNATLKRPVLRGTDMRGAVLDGTTVTDADTYNANYDEQNASLLEKASRAKE